MQWAKSFDEEGFSAVRSNSDSTHRFKSKLSRILPAARDAAFTRTNIVAAFEKTGIYPFNRCALPVLRRGLVCMVVFALVLAVPLVVLLLLPVLLVALVPPETVPLVVLVLLVAAAAAARRRATPE